MPKNSKDKLTNKSTKNLKPGISKTPITGKMYPESDVIFIANKFIQMGLNIQSIVQVMKEQAILEHFANDLQMQEVLQKLYKEKEKCVDFEDLQTKLLKIENIKAGVTFPDVFQISILEKLK